MDYFRRFRHPIDQAEVAAYLRERVPAGEPIVCYTYAPPFSLRYLTGRPVVGMYDALARGGVAGKVHLVLTPLTGTFFVMRPEGAAWIAAHGRLEAEFGRYSVYEVAGGIPGDASFLHPARAGYERHPGSGWWFGRRDPAGLFRRAEGGG
jgi:hypothetical protein